MTVSKLLLDSRNQKLLAALLKNPRASITDLARKVGLSAPATRERMLRLEEAGVIKGWRVELDPNALGFPIAVLVRVRPMPGQLPKIAKLAQSLPQVTECHRITGEDCFLIRAHLRARGAGRAARQVPGLWPDHHLDRAILAGRAAQPAAARWVLRLAGNVAIR
jgi:Lrp/AsnC family leucine-responsive transcriptional regulator